MIFEYLKKNRWALFNKWMNSAAILLVACLVIMGILLLTPIRLGVMVLFLANPVVFLGLFLAGLFFLSMMGSVVWFMIEQKWNASKPTSKGQNEMADEKNQQTLSLLNKPKDSSDLTRSSLFEKDEIIPENIAENNVPKHTDEPLTLETYSKESNQFISKARNAIEHKTFKNPDVFNALEEEFQGLKQKYYRLARRLHPDKNGPEHQERFKQLGNYYEEIAEAFEQLKTCHNEEDISDLLKKIDEKLKRWDETLQQIREQQAQMLRYLAEMKKETEERKKETEERKKETEERKNLNHQLERLIVQNTINTSDPEVQQRLASFQREQQASQQTNAEQASTYPTLYSTFFSPIWNFLSGSENSSAETKKATKN